jgi:exodeoxyribonuclease VII large subunit
MIRVRREKLDALEKSRALTDPMNVINDRRMLSDMLSDRLTRAMDTEIKMKRSELALGTGKLDALNPLSVISRGFSAVYKDDGTLVKGIGDVSAGDKISVKTIGGEAKCTVDEVKAN